jgi:hypothetical protein
VQSQTIKVDGPLSLRLRGRANNASAFVNGVWR